MKNSVLLTTLAACIVAGTTLAQGEEYRRAGPGSHFQFDEVDANSDGKITKAEILAHMEARFDKADANADGQVSEAELRSHIESEMAARIDKRVSHMMARHDENGDGQLNKNEMKPHRLGKMLKHADADGDGAISRAEFDAMKDKRGKHRKHKDNG